MNRFNKIHTQYRENTLNHRRFKHEDIQPLIEQSGFETELIGHSWEGRAIQKIVVGTGKRKALLWSQMHGDEATATMALFDILNFFKGENDGLDEYRALVLDQLQIHIVPMLNPDGAQRFQRRTAQEIDMNRDALALQCPESKILKGLIQSLKPEFSFNLHDQSIYYAAGNSPNQTAIAFLATAYNAAREWNEVRTKSMQLIVSMNQELQGFIPGKIGRFSDEFEPRAFGDNIQKWGSSLILIESGGYADDPEKQYLRKLNFQTILKSFETIATDNFKQYQLEQYEAIPENEKIFFDLKIKNLLIESQSKSYKIDLGIYREEENNDTATSFKYVSTIEEMGDLSVFYGIETIDAEGAKLRTLNEFPSLLEQDMEAPTIIKTGERATFVLDYGHKQTLVINGKVV